MNTPELNTIILRALKEDSVRLALNCIAFLQEHIKLSKIKIIIIYYEILLLDLSIRYGPNPRGIYFTQFGPETFHAQGFYFIELTRPS